MKMEDRKTVVSDEQSKAVRTTSRYDRFHQNGPASIKPNPTPGFACQTSVELIRQSERSSR